MIKLSTQPLIANLSASEAALLEVAREIGFGELLDVEIEDDHDPHPQPVSHEQSRFLVVLRRAGIRHADVIVVHNGVPTQIEIDGTLFGIKYKRKLRVA
jgi:hypothetical protein